MAGAGAAAVAAIGAVAQARDQNSMTPSAFREWLATLAEAQALVPATEVLDRLPAGMDDETPKVLGDLSVEEAGAVLKRSASTVRQYARQGFLPGAYRQQGREWRVPPEAIRTFQRREAERPLETAPAPPDGRKPSMHSGLTGWRDEWKDAAPIVQAGPVGVADPLTGSSLRASLAGALHRGAPRWP